MPIPSIHLRRALLLVLLVTLSALTAGVEAQSSVPPIPARGPNPVGCTNVEQDLSRVPAHERPEYYWRGFSFNETERYVTSLLVDREHALVATFTAPHDPSLFARWSGRTLTYALLVCYPTSPDNTRPNYVLPRGVVVPRMQRGGEAPILPSSARLPVLLFSHGYGGSPLNGGYLDGIVALASWGYVVVAPFHGDFRYSVFGPDNGGSDALYIPIWDEFVAMQATRPLSMSAALDLLSTHAQWRDHIDLARVGAFGISQGGETLMLMGGAALTNEILTLGAKRVTLDSRVRAAVGYVPYFGTHGIPAFGDQQRGVDGVTLPFLALSGTEDGIAPIDVTRTALDRMTGVRGQVALQGFGHELELPTADDIVTWTLTFFNAWLDGNATARSQLDTMQSVAGGLDDLKVLYAAAVANYQGLWWNPAESGWGINFAHQANAIYLTWYTYDAEGQASWLAMLANQTGGQTYAGDILEVRGSPYDVSPYDPAKKVVATVGAGTISFADASNGTFAFSAKGVTRSIPITRFSLVGAMPTCTFGASPNFAAATNYQDLWWGGAAEDGWGINFTHESTTLYATWYTFDTDGSPLWFAALMAPSGPGQYAGELLRSTGPPFGTSFDPSQVVSRPVGTATLDVTTGNALTWHYRIGATAGSKPITRFLFTPPAGTLCQ